MIISDYNFILRASESKKKMVQKKSSWNIKAIGELITTIGVIGGVGYGLGRWQSHIEHKAEILEIRQEYNIEITNLRIDYNNRILELQNELRMVESSKKTNK